MQKKSKLMAYVQADIAPDAIRWALRLDSTVSGFCNDCIRHCLMSMERGMFTGRETPFNPWMIVSHWLCFQGRPPKRGLLETTVERLRPQLEASYRRGQSKLEEFERDLLAGKANTKVLFQVSVGGENPSTHWADKVRRIAGQCRIKPNELVNRMIAAGITALEREDEMYEADFIAQYQKEFALPRIAQLRSERLLAEQFDTHADVPPELKRDGWDFIALNETANVHYRVMVDALIAKKNVEEGLKFISSELPSPIYLERMREIYLNPKYQDWSIERPLVVRQLKKDIIDAWVAHWKKNSATSRGSTSLAEIKSRLPDLTDDQLKSVEEEISMLRASRNRK